MDNNYQNENILPDKKVCKVKDINTEKIAECLVEKYGLCNFAVNYGNRIMCTNPEWKDYLDMNKFK